jgi:hypothetical protein
MVLVGGPVMLRAADPGGGVLAVVDRYIAVPGAVDDESRGSDAVEREVEVSRLKRVVVGARPPLLVREGVSAASFWPTAFRKVRRSPELDVACGSARLTPPMVTRPQTRSG